MPSWWGKFGGAILGGAIAGPFGVIIGAALGHAVDEGINAEVEPPRIANGRQPSTDEQRRILLPMGMMALAGKLSKMDGRITSEEIAAVNSAILSFGMDSEGEQLLRDVFREAKDSPHNYMEVAHDLAVRIRPFPQVSLQIIDFLIQVALSDGHLAPQELTFLNNVRQTFRVNDRHFSGLLSRYGIHERKQGRTAQRPTSGASFSEHYQLLGVTPSASLADIKRAYHDKVKRFHPDTLEGKDLDPEFLDFAKHKMSELNNAYETLKNHHQGT
jgi:DnaJ like chaperone protein